MFGSDSELEQLMNDQDYNTYYKLMESDAVQTYLTSGGPASYKDVLLLQKVNSYFLTVHLLHQIAKAALPY